MNADQQGQNIQGDQTNIAGDQHNTTIETVVVTSPTHRFVSRSSIGSTSSIDRQNRERLLKRVYTFWIVGVLERSLHNTALIALGLHEQPDAVENPWRLVVQETNQPARPLPDGTRITQVYDLANGGLLLLGEPGSGKTTLLLELARDLIGRAERDSTHPIPVVFNLSLWAEKRSALATWLVEELQSKYQVPRQVGQTWIDHDCILPLLDGLDEVAPAARAACIQAINAYRQLHNLVPIVVCSRTSEYYTRMERILLHNAVEIQPLSMQQIDAYIASAGGQLDGLRMVLREDPLMQEMATNPLMLSILTLIYQGKLSKQLIHTNSLEIRRKQVFEEYVQRVLTRRGIITDYSSKQTLRWMAWLAKHLALRNQTEFYIEHLQPDWITGEKALQRYYSLVGTLVGAIVGGLVGGIVGGVLVDNLLGITTERLYSGSTSGMLIYALFGALAGGLMGKENTRTNATPIVWSWENIWKNLFQTGYLGYILIYSLFSGLVGWLIVGRYAPIDRVLSEQMTFYRPMNTLLIGAGIGLVTRVVVRLDGQQETEQVSMKTSRWRNTWQCVVRDKYVKTGLVYALSGGFILGQAYGQVYGHQTYQWVYGLLCIPVSMFVSILLRGRKTHIEPAEVVAWSWKSVGLGLVQGNYLKVLRNWLTYGVLGILIWSCIEVVGEIYMIPDGLETALDMLVFKSHVMYLFLCMIVIGILIIWLLSGLFYGVQAAS